MNFEEINKKYNTEFTNKLFTHQYIFYEIYEACGNKFLHGYSSYLFDGQVYEYCDKIYEKQELLYNSVKNINNVLEIGTYIGHSLLIMLLSNPELKITCIDVSIEYTNPAIKILNKYFNNCIQFIHSNIINGLTALNIIKEKFDFFHINGISDSDYIIKEFCLIKKLNKNPNNMLKIILDNQEYLLGLQNIIDTHYNVIKKIIPKCLYNNLYYEIQL